MFKILHYGETNVGRERKNNEDAYRVAVDAGVYLVCDGMGGHASGEIASQIAADVMVRFLAMDRFRPDFRWPPESAVQQTEEGRALDAAVRAANREVFFQAQANPLHKGMGTTIVGVYAGRQRLGLVHVGDSRIYRFRNGELEQLTDDHSLLNYYMNTRPMSAQQIKSFAGKNVIVRAVGLRDNVEPDVQITDYKSGDVYLLCSDGLNDMVDDERIASVLGDAADNLAEAGKKLIQLALDGGGKDNVTVLLLQPVEVADQPKTAPFYRRTVPMTAISGFDTAPGVSLEDLHPEDEGDGGPEIDAGERSFIDSETMPGVETRGMQRFAATQPIPKMSRDDLTPPAGFLLPTLTARPTTSQEPTERIPRELAEQIRAAQQAQREQAARTSDPALKQLDPNEDTDPRGIAPVVVVVHQDGAAAGDNDFADAPTGDLPVAAVAAARKAASGEFAKTAQSDSPVDIDGPTLPRRRHHSTPVATQRGKVDTTSGANPIDERTMPVRKPPAFDEVKAAPTPPATPSAIPPAAESAASDGIDDDTQ